MASRSRRGTAADSRRAAGRAPRAHRRSVVALIAADLALATSGAPGLLRHPGRRGQLARARPPLRGCGPTAHPRRPTPERFSKRTTASADAAILMARRRRIRMPAVPSRVPV